MKPPITREQKEEASHLFVKSQKDYTDSPHNASELHKLVEEFMDEVTPHHRKVFEYFGYLIFAYYGATKYKPNLLHKFIDDADFLKSCGIKVEHHGR